MSDTTDISEREAFVRSIATEIYLDSSFAFLKTLFEKKTTRIISQYPTLNSLECEIEKGERCFTFKTGSMLDCKHPVQYQDDGYGLKKPFDLQYGENIYRVKHGPGKYNIHIGKGFTTDGELHELESPENSAPLFYRAIFPLSTYGQYPVHYIESGPFKTGTSLRILGYVTMGLAKYKLGFYDYDIDNKRYLFIDCHTQTIKKEFEELVDAISFSFGLISGCVQRDEVFYLGSDTTEFNIIRSFEIKRLPDSVAGWQAISPRDYKEVEKQPKTEYLPVSVFCTLVQQCLDDKRLLRAIKILTESFDCPFEIMASTFSVCLETLKNIVIEKNEEKINPFKEKSFARKTITELKTFIDAIDPDHFNNKEGVLKRIEQLNQVGNADSFFLVFDLLGIKLNEDDKNCIHKRNDFLHGRIPFEDEEEQVQSSELRHIVCKLHFLLTCVILKNAGYSGPILNNPKMNDIVFLKRGLNEPAFRKI